MMSMEPREARRMASLPFRLQNWLLFLVLGRVSALLSTAKEIAEQLRHCALSVGAGRLTLHSRWTHNMPSLWRRVGELRLLLGSLSLARRADGREIDGNTIG